MQTGVHSRDSFFNFQHKLGEPITELIQFIINREVGACLSVVIKFHLTHLGTGKTHMGN